jgi:CDP-diglyceride synthetase
MDHLDPLLCAVFLLLAFTLAGFVQSLWLRSRLSARLQVPLDGGRTLVGKRLLGDNKTWRGFAGMVPAVGAAFLLLALLAREVLPTWSTGLWSLSVPAYGLLGCWTGAGFMAGELPNSFLKRQFGIAPGAAPSRPWARVVCFVGDRLDSILGGFLALALVVPAPALVLLYLLLIGPAVHWAFSLLLFHFGVKARPA